jgi:hypothetical protein
MMPTTKREYGTVNTTASVGTHDGEVYGIFYRGGVRHIAPYVPYRRPASLTLCKRSAGAATRSIENICAECELAAKDILGTLVFA